MGHMFSTSPTASTKGFSSIDDMLTQLYLLQVNEKICNLDREYRDCIKSRRDKIGITRHIMMQQLLYNVHVTLFIG